MKCLKGAVVCNSSLLWAKKETLMTQSPAKKSFFNRNVDLMNGPIFRSLLVFMLPILVSCLFQQLYNTVDTMIVGNVLGDTALPPLAPAGPSTSFWSDSASVSATASPSSQRAPTGPETRTSSNRPWRVPSSSASCVGGHHAGGRGGPASAAGTAGYPGGNFRGRLRLYHHHRPRRHRHVCL